MIQAHAVKFNRFAHAVVQHAARIEAACGVLQAVLAGHARIAGHRPAQHSGRAAGLVEPVQLHAELALSI